MAVWRTQKTHLRFFVPSLFAKLAQEPSARPGAGLRRAPVFRQVVTAAPESLHEVGGRADTCASLWVPCAGQVQLRLSTPLPREFDKTRGMFNRAVRAALVAATAPEQLKRWLALVALAPWRQQHVGLLVLLGPPKLGVARWLLRALLLLLDPRARVVSGGASAHAALLSGGGRALLEHGVFVLDGLSPQSLGETPDQRHRSAAVVRRDDGSLLVSTETDDRCAVPVQFVTNNATAFVAACARRADVPPELTGATLFLELAADSPSSHDEQLALLCQQLLDPVERVGIFHMLQDHHLPESDA